MDRNGRIQHFRREEGDLCRDPKSAKLSREEREKAAASQRDNLLRKSEEEANGGTYCG